MLHICYKSVTYFTMMVPHLETLLRHCANRNSILIAKSMHSNAPTPRLTRKFDFTSRACSFEFADTSLFIG